MDLNKLHSFCKVYETGSFSRAAKELYLSQPTVSAHIHSLEHELGSLLFDRLNRGIMPTQSGRALYSHAKELLVQMDKAVHAVNYIQDHVAGDLLLGGSTIPGNFLLPNLMKVFKEQYPEVNLHLFLGDSYQIGEKIQKGHLDLGIVGADTGHLDLDFLPIMEDELVVVGLPELLGTKKVLDIETLLHLPWVIREQGSGTRYALQAALSELDKSLFNLQIAAVVHGTNAMLQCAVAGLGLVMTSRKAAQGLLNKGKLVSAQVPGLNLKRSFFSVRHKQKTLSIAASRFWQQLLAEQLQSQEN